MNEADRMIGEGVVAPRAPDRPHLPGLGNRGGANFPPELYDAQTWAALGKVPMIGGPESSTGSVEVSQEVLLAQNADLVVGEPEAINKDALARSNIPFIPYSFANCANPPPLYQELTGMGAVSQRNAEMAQQLADVLHPRS